MSKPLDEFPISISAYIADTQHLSTVQHGAYLLLLMAMRHSGGWLPDDEQKIANIVKMPVSKWRKIAPDIRELLVCTDGKLSQKRIISDIEKLKVLSAKNAENGRSGGIAKSLKNKATNVATAKISPSHSLGAPPENRQNAASAAIPSSLFESDSKEEVKKGNSRGSSLPSDWVPSERDYAYAAKLGLTAQEAEACGEDMKLWAKANANRAVGRKADWLATYHGWMRREAPKIIRQRSFKGGNGNGENRNGGGPKLGFAGIAAKLRQASADRADGAAAFGGYAGDRQPEDGRGFAATPLGGVDRAGQAPPFAPSPDRR